jgi:hypothetical protein
MKKWFRDFARFIKNSWKFRKELIDYYPFDYAYSLRLLLRSLIIQEENMRLRSNEDNESLDKKTKKMRRAIRLLQNKIEDNYVQKAEKELGKELKYGEIEFKQMPNGLYEMTSTVDNDETIKNDNREIIKYSVLIENKEWSELWDIIKGTKWKDWDNYDGSDMRHWWS